MYNLNDIALSKQDREGVARQVENNRLARQLWADRRTKAGGFRNSLPGRFLAWLPRKEQTAEC